MGWRTALTVVRGASVDDLARAGYTPDGGTSTPDEAIAEGLGDHLSVVAHGDDLVLIGRGTDPDLAATLHAALGVEVAHAFFMSTVDYYTWRVAHAGGTRTWSCGEGEVVVDEGEPLPEEGSLRVLDERGLRRLLKPPRASSWPTSPRGRLSRCRSLRRRRRGGGDAGSDAADAPAVEIGHGTPRPRR